MVASGACGGGAVRRGRTVVFASGAELQSMNPLVTIHPLAKQVQRYVLLTTLARYDTALVPRPYLARAWVWSPDLQALRFRLQSGVHWHDGTPTTARDVVWTLRSEEHTSELQSRLHLVCRLLLEKKKKIMLEVTSVMSLSRLITTMPGTQSSG